MAWWQFWRRGRGSTAVTGDATNTAHHTAMGRRFLRGVPYVLPKDMGEVNRLDFQHYMMRFGLRGNFAAPIGTPDSILDVGSGTGRWAIEMAELFPQAKVVGFDVAQPSTDERPARDKRAPDYTFVAGNVLEGLPFADASFAYVHQRYMIGAIPRDHWPHEVAELVRVTRPGGWVEVVEAGVSQGGGPGLQTVDSWVASVLARRNLDIHLGAQLETFLREAGLRDVVVRNVHLPLGAYGGRVGQLVETDYFAAVQAMRAPVVTLGIATEADYENTVKAAREEVSQGRCVFPVYVVYGKRP